MQRRLRGRKVTDMNRKIRCVACGEKVQARLTDGSEIYPHRADLSDLPFWKCDQCGNSVGCHHKTTDRTRPLGYIPTPELKNARRHLHALIDPLWQQDMISRSQLYKRISEHLGWQYHTAQMRSVEEAREVYRIVQQIKRELYDVTETSS